MPAGTRASPPDRLLRFTKIGGQMVPPLRVDALHRALGSAEPRLVVTSVSDEQTGEKLVVLHTDLGIGDGELLRRVRDSNLPKLRLPRKENFFDIEAFPCLAAANLV